MLRESWGKTTCKRDCLATHPRPVARDCCKDCSFGQKDELSSVEAIDHQSHTVIKLPHVSINKRNTHIVIIFSGIGHVGNLFVSRVTHVRWHYCDFDLTLLYEGECVDWNEWVWRLGLLCLESAALALPPLNVLLESVVSFPIFSNLQTKSNDVL